MGIKNGQQWLETVRNGGRLWRKPSALGGEGRRRDEVHIKIKPNLVYTQNFVIIITVSCEFVGFCSSIVEVVTILEYGTMLLDHWCAIF